MRSIMYHKKSILIIFIAICMLAPFIGALPVAHAADNTDDVQYEYIYLDLAAGNVTIDATSYTGFVFVNGTQTKVTGTHSSGNHYYVYQSTAANRATTGLVDGSDTVTLPTYQRMTYNGQSWGDYITNNTNPTAVANNWTTSAQAVGKESTPNHIKITGGSTYNVVIDNLWSTENNSSTSRNTGGIAFIPASGGKANISLVGDSRFGNIHYATGKLTNTEISFSNGEKTTLASMTVVSYDGKANHYNSVIGNNDGSDHSQGIVIDGGIIYAGARTKEGYTKSGQVDNCSAIGGGGNGIGVVTINGGKVTAVTSSTGAAIGGGIGESQAGGVGYVKITGGEVYAYNFGYVTFNGSTPYTVPAAAIGGASSRDKAGGLGTVTISGGKVFAYSVGGAAIGGGSSTKNGGGAANVTISGTAEVTAISVAGKVNGQDVEAGVSIGGGTAGNLSGSNNGGVATLKVNGGKLYTGSIGGGACNNGNGNIGAATVTINDGTLHGQIIMQGINPSTNEPSSFTMTGGTIDNTIDDKNPFKDDFVFLEEDGGAVCVKSGTATISGGVIKNCINTDYLGGAIYLSGGNVNMTGGTIQDCKAQKGGAVYINGGNMTMSGGAITQNTANENGGAAYLAGGSFTMSGGTMSGNTALNGAGALVANGSVIVTGGVITQNTATVNGGAFCISNGDYTMTGGELTYNRALTGDGGAIYVSSSQANNDITIRSGSITHNTAGKNGGALGVYGQNGINFVITIGSCTNHKDCDAGTHKLTGDDTKTETCPIIQNNLSQTSGGAIYLAGSYDAVMNMYCLVEKDNRVGDGVSTSNFMMVDGGTLNITSLGPNDEADFGKMEINSSIHVTGGRVTLRGARDNPMFVAHVTVDITQSGDGDNIGDFFNDLRTGGKGRVILYYENTPGSSQYVLIDEANPTSHTVISNVYVRPGYEMVGWELQYNKIVYPSGETIAIEGNLIFHATWKKLQYIIHFLPGVDDFDSSYDEPYQYFEYDKEQNLTPNGYTVYAYKFVEWHWVDAPEGTPIEDTIFTDGQAFTWPENFEKNKITLVAEWVICDHNGTQYAFTPTKTSVQRVCSCQAYTESLLLEAVNAVYQEGHQHVVDPIYQSISQNGYTPAPLWNGVTVSYSGTPNDNSSYGPTATAPINAGSYTVSITITYNDETHTISAPLFIDRAQRIETPATPQYEVTVETQGTDDTKDDVNIIKITDVESDIKTEYQFSWYQDGVLKQSGWIKWSDSPTQELSVAWTNYYVDVRYARTDNYYESQAIRGTKTIVWSADVTIIIRTDSQKGLNHSRVDPYEQNGNKEGVFVTLVPTNGYYIYNVDKTVTVKPKDANSNNDISTYPLPTFVSTDISGEEWTVQIRNIAEGTSYGGIIIEISFTGAEKKVVVDSSVVKNEEFKNVITEGENEVKISRDSAYTVCFDVKNYNDSHYSKPAILFSTAIPTGTTIIMVDYTDLSYWSYTAKAAVDKVFLSDFIRMGTQSTVFNCEGKQDFTLQFVVDFSDCAEKIDSVTIRTSFEATPQYPEPLFDASGASGVSDGRVMSVPDLSKFEEIQLVKELTFEVGTPSGTGLTQSLSYQFAYSPIEGVGISKWDNTCGILVITPKNPAALPADARLQVKIANSIKTYSLIDGKFTVALLSSGEGEVTITFLSGMLPNQNATFEFDVQLYVSATAVRTTPKNELLAQTSLVYTVTQTLKPVVHVSFDGELPQYLGVDEAGKGIFTSFNFHVSLGAPLEEGWEIRAELYAQNPNNGYTNTTQKGELTKINDKQYDGMLKFDSFEKHMVQNKGSLSLMLKIEILDQTGQVLNSVPLYFVLIDTRQ